MKTKSLKAIMILAGALLLLFNPLSSKADPLDTLNLTLGIPNDKLSSFTSPYATASIVLTDSTHATITIDALTTGAYTYLLGDGSAAAANVTGTFTATVSESNSNSGFAATFSATSSGNVDGFGNFSLTIDNNAAFTKSATEIIITLVATGSTTWGSIDDPSLTPLLLDPTNKGYLVAAHILPWSGLYDEHGNPINTYEGKTGYAANGVPVPEPGILILLGIAMSAVGIVSRYVRKI